MPLLASTVNMKTTTKSESVDLCLCACPSFANPSSEPRLDEELLAKLDGADPSEFEGMEEEEDDDDLALNVAEGEAEDGSGRKLPNLQVVQMRMQSAVRALGNWAALGSQTGKSRSEVMEQFIQDICEYYGYNEYLAEKLLNLFPIDEVRFFVFLLTRRDWDLTWKV
jgi:hypothetical protein